MLKSIVLNSEYLYRSLFFISVNKLSYVLFFFIYDYVGLILNIKVIVYEEDDE